MIKRKLKLDREVVTAGGPERKADPDGGIFPGPTGCICTFDLCTLVFCTEVCPTIIPDSDIYC